jgi:hypothetical protein
MRKDNLEYAIGVIFIISGRCDLKELSILIVLEEY